MSEVRSDASAAMQTGETPGRRAAPAEAIGLATRWYVAIMMCLVYTLSFSDRYSISTVLEPIRRQMQLSDVNVAFLTGVSLGLFYVLFGFPLSWLIDRYSRRNIIGASLIAWSAFTTATGLSRGYGQLLWSRIGVGVGEAGGTPGANSLLSDYFPAERRPMALNFFSLGAPIGSWIGSQIAGDLAYRFGWRTMFMLLGIPGVIVGVLIFLTVREPHRGRLDAPSREEAPPFLKTLRFLWSQRSAMHLLMAAAMTALWGWGLLWWTPAFLMTSYSLNVAQAGTILGPVNLIGGGASMIGTTWLLSRPSLADHRRVVHVRGASIALATVVTAVIYSTHSLALTRWLFWVYIPLLYAFFGTNFGMFNNLAKPQMRAMCCAIMLFVANVCNLIVAPQLVGFLSDWFAPHGVPTAMSLRLAMLCLVPLGFWASWHFFRSSRGLIEDERRANALL